MNEPEGIRQAVEAAANDPRVATAVAAGTASMGIAEKLNLIQGFAGTISMILGCATAAVVLAIQLLKLSREWNKGPSKGDE